MERINDDVVNAAWNLFGLTGGIEEYLLYRDIKNKSDSRNEGLSRDERLSRDSKSSEYNESTGYREGSYAAMKDEIL